MPAATEVPQIPDMKWTEPACVVYVLIFLVVNVAVHRCLHRRGDMHWGVVAWSSVSRGIGCCSAGMMAMYRLAFAAYVLAVDWVLWDQPPLLDTHGSAKTGPNIFATFTIWSWTLVGVYFLLAGVVSLLEVAGCSYDGCLARTFLCCVWALFEVMFTTAILICVTVWLVLLPMMYMLYGTDAGMLFWGVLSAHNANVVFMMIEAGVNRLCFVPAHYVFVVYYGAAYVIFSWWWFAKTGIFFYFFIDWRHWFALVGYTGLLGSLAFWFWIGRCLVNCVKWRSSSTLLIRKLSDDVNSESSDESESSLSLGDGIPEGSEESG